MIDMPVVPPGGKHLIVELWSGMTDFLQSTKWTREICFAAAKSAGATVIADHFHHFGGQHGVSGTVILAESHISIHTWPETGYASIDVFMCGQCDPLKTIETFVEGFCANKTQFKLIDRPSQQIVVDKKIEGAYIYSNS